MPETKTKPKSAAPKTTALALPEHMKLTENEAAICARLIRVYRSERYWLRYFIEHLLHMDVASSVDVTTEQAQWSLNLMKNFESWQDFFDDRAKEWPVLKDFPGMEWYPLTEGPESLAGIVEKSFSREERLEAELKTELAEIRANLESGHVVRFNEAAAEFARRMGRALDRMAEENR